MARAAIYARKSTESEDRQVLSISSQISELRDLASRENLGAAVVFTESKSAKAPGRPVFDDVMERLQKGEFECLVCWKLDRLARNPVDGGTLIWAMEERRLRHIYTPQRRFDNTANDKFWMQLEFGMAKKYVDDLSDNVKRGLKAKLQGGWIPCIPPLGYLNDRASRRIVKDPQRFRVVRRMWQLLLSGSYTPNAVAKIASERWGLTTRQYKRFGGGPFTGSSVYKLFTNPFYCGQILYNGQYYKGAHRPMITAQEFQKVQLLLGKRQKERPQRLRFAYTGMIRCGECGASVTAENKINRQGHRYVYYHCTRKKIRFQCRQRCIEEKALESQIQSFLDSLTIPEAFVRWAVTVLREREGEDEAAEEERKESIRRRLRRIDRELGELLNLKLRELLSESEFVNKRKSLQREGWRLEASLKEERSNSSKRTIEVLTLASEAASIYKRGSKTTKRRILRQVGSNLILRDKTLEITASEPFQRLRDSTVPSDKSGPPV